MATLGEYGSLLQLGFGIGIGLSVFRAPMELLSVKLKSDLDAEFAVLEKVISTRAGEQRGKLSDLQLQFSQTASWLDRMHLPFMIASIIAAIVNWIFLAIGSSSASYQLNALQEWGLFLVAGPIYLLISIVLAALTFAVLRPIRARLDSLRS